MDNSKRNKKRNQNTVNPDLTPKVIQKYLNINQSNLTEDDLTKILQYFNYKIESAEEAMKSNNSDQLYEIAEESLKKSSNLDSEFLLVEQKHKNLNSEYKKLKDSDEALSKRLADKEKYSKLLIDKINMINQEKNQIISEESEKRNNMVKETEAFVRSLQPKYEEELKEKMKLIEENQNLRSEIEKLIQNSNGLKDVLENQLKEREKMSENMESKIKNDLKSRMENLSLEAQRLILENSELKIQSMNYKKKNEEMRGIVDSFNKEYDKLNAELDKKKADIILLSAENFELKKKLKNYSNNSANSAKYKKNLEDAHKEMVKVNNQIQAMKSLNKNLNDQLSKLKEMKNKIKEEKEENVKEAEDGRENNVKSEDNQDSGNEDQNNEENNSENLNSENNA